MIEQCDVLVIGAGPAGMEAAIAASCAGAKVIVAERAPWEGGQIFRHNGIKRNAASARPQAGAQVKRRFHASGLDIRFNATVVAASKDRVISLAGASGLQRVQAKAVIVACGASERVIPFPGWTAPGVIGLAALTNMMKGDDAVPAGQIVLSGVGPLLYSAAYKAHSLGARISAIVDPLPTSAWLRALPNMVVRPWLLATGVYWRFALFRAGVPIITDAHITEVAARGAVNEVLVHQGQGQRTHRFNADAVCVGHGLRPNTEITRLIGAEHEFLGERGGLVPKLDAHSQTTVAGYFVAGDCSGVSGAEAALRHGSEVGRWVAGTLGMKARTTPLRLWFEQMRMRIARRFGAQMARLAAPRLDLYEEIASDTVICRCEEVTRGEYDTDIQMCNPNTTKMRTRCGMGPCQGRYCSDTAAFLLARHRQVPIGEVERWTPRLPILPTSIDDLIGQYRDEDLVSSAASAAERGLYD
ncbi:FAD-dependent oxidoreductase [Pseudomonas putida]|uniref:FAD-dependent oxidoreductase n=1 Tax=Pseudomonas putida TaxID=303 RepID=UPI003F33246A